MIKNLRYRLEQYKGQYNRAKEIIKQSKEQSTIQQKRLHALEQAAIIIQHVAQMTQQEIEFRVSELVSHGLAAVFDTPYTYELKYVVRRDKTEADQSWKLGDREYLPSGGGVRDVSAFALQIAALVLSKVQNRDIQPILFLDESFKCLKPSAYQERAGKIIQELSHALNIQILIITHDTALSSQLDRVYKTKLDKRRISHVTVQNNIGY